MEKETKLTSTLTAQMHCNEYIIFLSFRLKLMINYQYFLCNLIEKIPVLFYSLLLWRFDKSCCFFCFPLNGVFLLPCGIFYTFAPLFSWLSKCILYYHNVLLNSYAYRFTIDFYCNFSNIYNNNSYYWILFLWWLILIKIKNTKIHLLVGNVLCVRWRHTIDWLRAVFWQKVLAQPQNAWAIKQTADFSLVSKTFAVAI